MDRTMPGFCGGNEILSIPLERERNTFDIRGRQQRKRIEGVCVKGLNIYN